jgi:hypothetical protein
VAAAAPGITTDRTRKRRPLTTLTPSTSVTCSPCHPCCSFDRFPALCQHGAITEETPPSYPKSWLLPARSPEGPWCHRGVAMSS